jgi:hypothetical protein
VNGRAKAAARGQDVRAALAVVADEDELFAAGDVEELRCVRGVDDLVADVGEAVEKAVEVALRVRA